MFRIFDKLKVESETLPVLTVAEGVVEVLVVCFVLVEELFVDWFAELDVLIDVVVSSDIFSVKFKSTADTQVILTNKSIKSIDIVFSIFDMIYLL